MKFFQDKPFTLMELGIVLLILLFIVCAVPALVVYLFGKDALFLLLFILAVVILSKHIYKTKL